MGLLESFKEFYNVRSTIEANKQIYNFTLLTIETLQECLFDILRYKDSIGHGQIKIIH